MYVGMSFILRAYDEIANFFFPHSGVSISSEGAQVLAKFSKQNPTCFICVPFLSRAYFLHIVQFADFDARSHLISLSNLSTLILRVANSSRNSFGSSSCTHF